jgi:hypothetical protein
MACAAAKQIMPAAHFYLTMIHVPDRISIRSGYQAKFRAAVRAAKLWIEMISNFPDPRPSSRHEKYFDLGNFIFVAHPIPR